MKLEVPTHVGIIMDGNGRYAKSLGKPRSYGHKAGADNLKKLCKHILKRGIKYLSLYAFSTDNFKRPKEEVDYLMKLFVTMFTNNFDFLKKEDVKVLFSGRKEGLPEDVIAACEKIEKQTQNKQKYTLNICLNYGSQEEITDTFKKIIKQIQNGQIDIEDVDKNLISKNLYQDLPPLDFVIRTSGEKRLSNFMLWQSSYAEFYFPKCYFPEFDEVEFDKALDVYRERKRRFGGLNKN